MKVEFKVTQWRPRTRAPEVGFGEIAANFVQARFWITSGFPINT